MPANKNSEAQAGSTSDPTSNMASAVVAARSAPEQDILLALQESLMDASKAIRAYQKELEAGLAQDGLDSPEAIEAAIAELKEAEPELWLPAPRPDQQSASARNPGPRSSHRHARI